MRTYDGEGYRFGIRLVCYFLLVSFVFLLAKCTFIWRSRRHDDIDQRLQKTIVIVNYVPGFLLDIAIGTAGMLHSIYVLRSIMNKVRTSDSRSLSECYEIRQTKCTLQWVKKMLFAYLGLFICVLPFASTLFYLYVFCGLDTDTLEIQILNTILTMLADGYNLVSTLFMYFEFPQLKKAIYQDFSWILPSITKSALSRKEETNVYFINFNKLINALRYLLRGSGYTQKDFSFLI
ncbi:unnamed protein product [Bursaphelenchus okinawaensis]|uniref:Uncharacterized protein n=1 Tax=Bursaphelenchus okinawaensis TaxID=465554 RepID=A0A811LGH2_9BILA|nr:unnamed protein product [Bursaphelenchus okinawaensis]CAG9121984.1 unnamed protein product [Bursaphelenchus okinawaensis]